MEEIIYPDDDLNAENNPTVSLTYDDASNVETRTNERGFTWSFVYDAMNRVIEETRPDDDENAENNPVYAFVYDAAGNLIEVTNPLALTTEHGYDELNRMIETTNAAPGCGCSPGETTTYGLSANGNITSVTNAENETTSYTFDSVNQQTAMTNALASTWSSAYDGLGRMNAESDPVGMTETTTFYVNTPWATQNTSTLGGTSVFGLDPLGNPIEDWEACCDCADMEFNAMGNPSNRNQHHSNAMTDNTTYVYNSLAQPTEIIGPDVDGAGPLEPPVTTLTYAPRGWLASEEDGSGHLTEYDYDPAGNLISVTASPPTLYEYDAQNRLIKVTDPEGGETQYAYDLAGRLISVTDPEDNTTEYEYDNADRLIVRRDPLENETLYEYDDAGRLTRLTDRNGRITEYAYDDAGQRTAEVWLDAEEDPIHTVTYVYDAIGRVVAADDGFSKYGMTYTVVGNKLQVVTDNAGTPDVPYTVLTGLYDKLGRLHQVTDVLPAFDLIIDPALDGVDPLNEIQTITLNGTPTSGTLSLSVLAEPIEWDYDATTGEVEDLLEALDGIEPGDVIVTGGPGNWSIEFAGQFATDDVPLIILTGSTLNGATIAHDTTTGGGTGQDEVQTVTLQMTLAGQFTLTFDGQTTAAIAYDATAAAVDAALEALSNIGPGDVFVSRSGAGTPSQPYDYTVEFTGNLAETDVPELTSDASALVSGATIQTTQESAGTNEVQTVEISGIGAGRSFTLTFDGQTSAPISSRGAAAEVDAALEALANIGAGNVIVTGGVGGPWTVEFTGDLALEDVPLMTANPRADFDVQVTEVFPGGVVNETVEVEISGAAIGPQFWLEFDGQATAGISTEASAGELEAALEGLSTIGAGNVSVTGSAGGPYTIEFIGDLALMDVPGLHAHLGGGAATIDYSRSFAALDSIAYVHNGLTTHTIEFTRTGELRVSQMRRYAHSTSNDPLVTDYTYDILGRIGEIAHSYDETPLATFEYAYNQLGELEEYVGPGGDVEYTYDDTHQLTGATGDRSESYSYDSNGNRVTSYLHDDDYVTGPNNQLLSDGVFDYTYDNEGNRLTLAFFLPVIPAAAAAAAGGCGCGVSLSGLGTSFGIGAILGAAGAGVAGSDGTTVTTGTSVPPRPWSPPIGGCHGPVGSCIDDTVIPFGRPQSNHVVDRVKAVCGTRANKDDWCRKLKEWYDDETDPAERNAIKQAMKYLNCANIGRPRGGPVR